MTDTHDPQGSPAPVSAPAAIAAAPFEPPATASLAALSRRGTINGKGFPATAPVVARLGQRVLIRFMNEGVMMHPWHLHGMPMRVVARDGYPLGTAAFTCDTIGVNPGERWDVIIDARNAGVWAFHCHILTHAEGHSGMFGMVTAMIVER